VLDSVPAALDEVVLRALAKDPSRRYADADEFIAALERDREALPASAGAAVLAAGAFGAEAWAAAGGREPPAPPFASGAADPGTGALMLPPAAPPGEDTGISRGEGPRPKTVLLWSLAAALVAGAIALAVLAGGGGGRVTVPYVVGQTELVAAAKLRGVGLLAVASAEPSAAVTSGLVIRQSPALGARVAKGTRVSIVVSSGPGSAALPAVEGLSTAEALRNLRAAGFKPTTRSQSSATIARGRVIGTDPPTGTETQLGSAVVVLVSSGPAQLRVPEVVGESQKGAEGSLANAGLVVGPITTVTSTSQPPGSVLSQSPSAGASVPAGSPVSLTVAQAPTEIPVPNVVGNNQTQAAATLGGAGFVPKTVTATTTDPTKVGVVLKQSPGAGQGARKGATVTLTVGKLGSTTTTTPTNTATTPAPTPTPTTTTPTTTSPAPSG
jgi:serine/threonine-protein kinase